ncbi:MAG: gamma carbonic anhydrase family protein [Planctomycetes bacterium]|nr:gamma carbonic anhydrase family protein [Planctomycetota bacterium]MBI3847305.1 gamma carbonic anhydrase family protein [Planctomycetota bacterium]
MPLLQPFGDAASGLAYVADTATIVGRVTLGRGASVWFGSVLRGDDDSITIGEMTNVQDLCMVHADPGIPLTVGKEVTIGHSAVIHCRSVGDRSLIGIGAVLLKGAVIGEGSLVAAGAVISESAVIPPRSLVVGIPGRVIRKVTDEEWERFGNSARAYHEKALRYARGEFQRTNVTGR